MILTWIAGSHGVLEGTSSSTDISTGGVIVEGSGGGEALDVGSKMSSGGSASTGETIGGLTGVSFALDILFETLAKTRAFRAGGKGPVRIRACDALRLVRTGPVVRAMGGSSGAGLTGVSEVGGGVVSMVAVGLSV